MGVVMIRSGRTRIERHSSLGSSLLAAASQLVTENDDLQIGVGHRALARPDQAEETTQEQVEEGPDHGGALSQTAA